MEADKLHKALGIIALAMGEQASKKARQIIAQFPEADGDIFLESLLLDLQSSTEPVTVFAKAKQHYARRFTPVDIKTFVENPFYLGLKGEVYPKVMEYLQEMNSGQYDEAVLTGAIGVAKTTLALWTTAYQLYLLSSYVNPQQMLGLDHSSEIVFIFQSISGKLAKVVEYDRFRALVSASPYFTQYYCFDKELDSECRFPNRVVVKPVSGVSTAAIGQNVFGGVIDEVNYMAVVEKSKQSIDGGTYDQAIALYNSIARRRKSRFMRAGHVPGMLCLVSSKRYPGQFTDQKEEEARKELAEKGYTTIYIYDKRTWEVLPEDRFSGEFFNVFTGDQTRKPRILMGGEAVSVKDRNLVLPVPVEYKEDFAKDIMDALREIGGVSTLARHPFFINTEAVAALFSKSTSILSRTEVDFVESQLQIYPKRFVDPEEPRWCHIDLGVTGDAAGLAIGYIPKFVSLRRGDELKETLPVIAYDCTLRITPPKGGEIQFHKIRSLLYKLREFGLNIKWVSLDSFQSVDMLQILRAKGFVTGMQSVDSTTLPYDVLKTAVYDGRVESPEDNHAELELASLERDPKLNKIDHPPRGSKDVGDAMAGVAYGLTMRRELWARHGVAIMSIPDTIKQLFIHAKDNMVESS